MYILKSRSQNEQNQKWHDEKLTTKNHDGNVERKKAFNQMQQPGEVDNSVEVAYSKRPEKKRE